MYNNFILNPIKCPTLLFTANCNIEEYLLLSEFCVEAAQPKLFKICNAALKYSSIF